MLAFLKCAGILEGLAKKLGHTVRSVGGIGRSRERRALDGGCPDLESNAAKPFPVVLRFGSQELLEPLMDQSFAFFNALEPDVGAVARFREQITLGKHQV